MIVNTKTGVITLNNAERKALLDARDATLGLANNLKGEQQKAAQAANVGLANLCGLLELDKGDA